MPTGRQIRAARVLLDLDAVDLAKRVGVRRETISFIENEQKKPRAETIEKIKTVFADYGIEFLGEKGITQRDDQVVTLKGENIFFRILDEVIFTLKDQPNAEALFACVSDSLSSPQVIDNYNRLRRLGIKMRSLIREGDTELCGKLDEYRCLPKEYFINTPMVIYGDKIATMLYDAPSGGVITERSAIIVHNTFLAASQRNLFNFAWISAQRPTKKTGNRSYD